MSLQDRMSGPLSKILKAMDSTIKVMEKMENSTERLDQKTLANARKNITNASAEFERMRASVESTTQSTSKLNAEQAKLNQTSGKNGAGDNILRLGKAVQAYTDSTGKASAEQQKLNSIIGQMNPSSNVSKLESSMYSLSEATSKAATEQAKLDSALAKNGGPIKIDGLTKSMASVATSTDQAAKSQDQYNRTVNSMKPPSVFSQLKTQLRGITTEIQQATTMQAKFAVVTNQLRPSNILERLKTVMKQHGDSADRASKQQDNFNESVHNGLGGLKSLAAGILGAVGAYKAFSAAKTTLTDILSQGIDFHAFKQGAEVAFTTFLGDAEKAKQYMDDMYAFALKTPFAYPDLLESSRNLIAFGISAQNTFPIMQAIGDAVASVGGGNAEMQNMADIFGQIQAQGRITAMEVNRLSQYGINAYEILGDAAGMSAAEMRKQISKGAIDSGTAIDALVKGMDKKFGGMMEGLKGSWAGLIDSFKSAKRNAGAALTEGLMEPLSRGIQTAIDLIKKIPTVLGPAVAAFGPLIDAFNETFAGGRFDGVFESLAAGLGFVANTLSWMGQMALWVAGIFADNWSWIAPTLFIMGTVLAAITGILLFKYAVLGAIRLATLAWAAAQWIVNAAYLSNPIVWALLIIVAVIALVIYALYAWAEQTATVVGYITGSILWLGQAFSNTMLWIVNIGMAAAEWFANTWNQAIYFVQVAWFALGVFIQSMLDLTINGIISAAQVMINIWNDATYGVQMAFHHMASSGLSIMSGLASGVVGVVNSALGAISALINTAVSGLNALIGMANKVPGVEIGAVGTVDFKVGNGAASAFKAAAGAIPAPTRKSASSLGSYSSGKSSGTMPQAPGNVSFDRKEYGNLGDAFDRGFNSGFDLTMSGSDKLTGAIDKITGMVNGKDMNTGMLPGSVPNVPFDPTNGTGKAPGAGGKAPGGGKKAPGGADKKGKNPTGGKLDKIGKIEDEINIADEDLKMLRDLAEEKSIKNFITLHPSVNFKDTVIQKDVDADAVIRKIEKAMEADVARSVEGVFG